MDKLKNPYALLHYGECSLIQMTRMEVMNIPAGDRRWTPALLEGTGIDIVFPCQGNRGPRTQEANGSSWLMVLGSEVRKILVSCNQVRMINRTNISLYCCVSSVDRLWLWKLAWVYSQAFEHLSLRTGFYFFSMRASSPSTGNLHEIWEFKLSMIFTFLS